jgi:hypothetical protein
MPPFCIRVDSPSPNSICVIGNKVTGAVILNSAEDQAVGSVQITFFGRAKTKIYRSNGQSRQTYKGRADFFRFTETLYTGKFTLRANEYVWPFSFAFPDAALSCVGQGQWKPSGGFHSQSRHPLPPTFSASHHGFSGNYESFIEYKLEAKLSRPPDSYVFYSRGIEADASLKFSPTRAIESPEPDFKMQSRNLSHSSLLLLPENEGRALTFKEKTKSIFKSSELPRSSFAIFAELPRVICSNDRIPIFIGVKHLLENSTAPQLPVIKLQSFALTLVATTSVRAPRHMSFAGEVSDTTSEKYHLENRTAVCIPITERTDLRNYYTNRGGRALVPTFSTYNICRSYRLELKLTVQCVDKNMTVEFMAQQIVVLPQIYASQEPSLPPSSQKYDMLAQERESNGQNGTSGATSGPADECLPQYTPQYTPRDPESTVGSAPEATKMGVEDISEMKNTRSVK